VRSCEFDDAALIDEDNDDDDVDNDDDHVSS